MFKSKLNKVVTRPADTLETYAVAAVCYDSCQKWATSDCGYYPSGYSSFWSKNYNVYNASEKA